VGWIQVLRIQEIIEFTSAKFKLIISNHSPKNLNYFYLV